VGVFGDPLDKSTFPKQGSKPLAGALTATTNTWKYGDVTMTIVMLGVFASRHLASLTKLCKE